MGRTIRKEIQENLSEYLNFINELDCNLEKYKNEPEAILSVVSWIHELQDLGYLSENRAWYLIGNCYHALYAGDASNATTSTKTDFLCKAKDCFEGAIKKSFEVLDESTLPYALANLANCLSSMGRKVEALRSWAACFNVKFYDPPIIARLSSAQTLEYLSHFIEEPNHRFLFLKRAQHFLSELNILDKSYGLDEVFSTGERLFTEIKNACNDDRTYKQLINSLTFRRGKSPSFEKWCLDNHLYLNFLQLIENSPLCAKDFLQWPSYEDKITESMNHHDNHVCFSRIKNEYAYARDRIFHLTHARHKDRKHQKNLYLTDVIGDEDYSWSALELTDTIKRLFSCRDKLMDLGDSFFTGEKTKELKTSGRKVREWQDKSKDNHFLDAYYHIICEFNEPTHWENNKAKGHVKTSYPRLTLLKELRDLITHRNFKISLAGESDIAEHLISRLDLEYAALRMLSFTRDAMLYFVFAIKFEQDRRNKSDANSVYLPQLFPFCGENEVALN